MSACPLTVEYILFMIDRHGSRTLDVLMDYGRASDEVVRTFELSIEKGYLEDSKLANKPYLTDSGREKLRDYYGTDLNGYDE